LFDLKVINSIKDILLTREETIAVAESVTAGMLQLAFSQADDAIHFFQGGITAYNIGQKSRHLNIDPIEGDRHNCVSERTVSEMATNVCRLFSSHWGIGISGYASPVPESRERIYAWYAIAHNGIIKSVNKVVPKKDSPLNVQLAICKDVLTQFHELFTEQMAGKESKE